MRRKNFCRRRNFLYLCLRIFFRRFFRTLDIRPLLYARESRVFYLKMQDVSASAGSRAPAPEHFARSDRSAAPIGWELYRRRLDLLENGFLYCTMFRRILLVARYVCYAALFVASLSELGCAAKAIQYKEDHDRIVRIDAAVEALRRAYAERDYSGFENLLLPSGRLDPLQRDVQSDFEAFHDIALEFAIERMLIDGDTADVFVHWQGQWKHDPSDAGIRQRGHARLQWTGIQSILLRDVEGDLPFGMQSRTAGAEPGPSVQR